jgi:hypothetical protein
MLSFRGISKRAEYDVVRNPKIIHNLCSVCFRHIKIEDWRALGDGVHRGEKQYGKNRCEKSHKPAFALTVDLVREFKTRCALAQFQFASCSD